jgi:hypothetical protein
VTPFTGALIALSIIAVGCERSSPARPSSRANAPVSTRPAEPEAPRLSHRLVHPESQTVIAIGDLHGDLDAARRALRLAGAIDTQDHWIGDKLVVVQTGDVIDRGDQDREVIDLLERVRHAARAAGGDLILLWGNHELMNTVGDLRYVTDVGLTEFGGAQGRYDAFKPGGPYAMLLADHALIAKVGDTVFVHGGILPAHIAYGLDRLNDELRDWMTGKRPEPPAVAVAEDGVLWTRAYSTEPLSCALLTEALAALHAKRMVVAHTVQPDVNAACDGRVWRIDTGMSRFYGGRVQVLELRRDHLRVRREGE